MPASLAHANVAVIGGDLRQLAVAKAIARLDGRVKTYGLPSLTDEWGVKATASLAEVMSGAAVIILPISGSGPDGRVLALPDQPTVILDEIFWQLVAPGALVLIGSLSPKIKALAQSDRFRVIEYAEIDEIAIMNAIPTAEGALQLAMEALPITIHGCCCLILGMGRVGITTARLFKAVGAETWVAANRPALQARAHEMGCRAFGFADLPGEITQADLVINTVPALVLPESVLKLTKSAVYLIDLASAPGGIDYQAAQTLGRRSILALGLPGKVAPETAGRILATALPAIIIRHLNEQGGWGHDLNRH